jgi:hypothetical protein
MKKGIKNVLSFFILGFRDLAFVLGFGKEKFI